MPPIEAALKFIDNYIPNCDLAILGGSIIRGDYTNTSDLDIVVICNDENAPYRESFIEYNWPIELFVHTKASLYEYFNRDCKRARPSLPRMCWEGVVIKDKLGYSEEIKKEAKRLLDMGPPKWEHHEIEVSRYGISELLYDLEGSIDYIEDIFTVNKLIYSIHEFVLRTNNYWIGEGKWVWRALQQYDINFCSQLAQALNNFYKNHNKDDLINLCDEVLRPYGGRLFKGFSIGKNQK
ncbi:hypothetical protein B1A75_02870 [Geobacillus sp. LEMMY01]|nr:hypothetical protein B1A75_02870 [Geobacillus sp. LEMMY01]